MAMTILMGPMANNTINSSMSGHSVSGTGYKFKL